MNRLGAADNTEPLGSRVDLADLLAASTRLPRNESNGLQVHREGLRSGLQWPHIDFDEDSCDHLPDSLVVVVRS